MVSYFQTSLLTLILPPTAHGRADSPMTHSLSHAPANPDSSLEREQIMVDILEPVWECVTLFLGLRDSLLLVPQANQSAVRHFMRSLNTKFREF